MLTLSSPNKLAFQLEHLTSHSVRIANVDPVVAASRWSLALFIWDCSPDVPTRYGFQPISVSAFGKQIIFELFRFRLYFFLVLATVFNFEICSAALFLIQFNKHKMFAYSPAALLLVALSVLAEASSDTCYLRIDDQIRVKHDWFACSGTSKTPSGASLCCQDGDMCGPDMICRTPDVKEGNEWYVGGCTDKAYNDPVCTQDCSKWHA
jgi:hypothetical protein